MSYHESLKKDPRATLFDAMDDVRAGMLGLTAGGDGMQPMTHFPDNDNAAIWFISSTDTQLVQGIDHGEDATYCVIGRNHDLHACIMGKLYHVQDMAKLKELWSPMVGAWFENGPEDTKVALLRFDLQKAEVWASDVGIMRFGYEMARSAIEEGRQPDLGSHAQFRFDPK